MFAAPALLLGLFAALGPLIIHLLNRRRYKTIEWGPMDFLRVAVRRNKRVMQIRDMLLLLLRTLAVLFFVLALAQPFFSSDGEKSYGGEPVHAVIIVDNTMSMGYQTLDKSLLDTAKEKAGAFIRQLPSGSRISVAPLSGDRQNALVHTNAEDALDALSRIELHHTAASASEALELAKANVNLAPEVTGKRIVLFTDLQSAAWDDQNLTKQFEDLENVQIVQLGKGVQRRANVWISDFKLVEGFADAATPATFVANVRYEGNENRNGVRAVLKVGESIADDRTIDLVPGQDLQLLFRTTFDTAGTAAEPLFVPVTIELSSDELNADNARTVIVPVLAKLPVVFVDMLGSTENPRLNRFGETYPLRRLLSGSQLIEIRHITPAELAEANLKDARLLVVGGVTTPTSQMVDLLTQYAQQGGRVLIAAGGDFDPLIWNDLGWRDGNGILPAPIATNETIGQLPSPAEPNPITFALDTGSLIDPAFAIEATQTERQEIFSAPFFYKAIKVEEEELDSTTFTLAMPQRQWLDWRPADARDIELLSEEQRKARTRAIVMGRYSGGSAFAVRRNMGLGTVAFYTSGIYPEWNSVAAGAGIILFDQWLRTLLEPALPNRTFQAGNILTIPVESKDQSATFALTAPGADNPISLTADPTSETTFGIRFTPETSGIYTLKRLADEGQKNDWTRQFAVNGAATESNLAALSSAKFESLRDGNKSVRLVSNNEGLTLEGTSAKQHRLWKWLIGLVILILAAEMFLLREKKEKAEAA